jgi:hypothetical protein
LTEGACQVCEMNDRMNEEKGTVIVEEVSSSRRKAGCFEAVVMFHEKMVISHDKMVMRLDAAAGR